MGSASRDAHLRSFDREIADVFRHVLQYPPLTAAQEEERGHKLIMITRTTQLTPAARKDFLDGLRTDDQFFLEDAWEEDPDIVNLAIILMLKQNQGPASFDELLNRTPKASWFGGPPPPPTSPPPPLSLPPPAAAGGYAGALADAAPVLAQASIRSEERV